VSQVRWTDEAVSDLASIKSYIERDSPTYAQLIVERLIERAERISSFPMAGRTVPEFDRPDLREVIFGSYRIVYWVEGDVQHLLTIFHSSRLLPLSESDLP
jgi:addiction module RelE/StbE family toxin